MWRGPVWKWEHLVRANSTNEAGRSSGGRIGWVCASSTVVQYGSMVVCRYISLAVYGKLQLVVCEYASLELVQSHTHPALHTITAYLPKLWLDHWSVMRTPILMMLMPRLC